MDIFTSGFMIKEKVKGHDAVTEATGLRARARYHISTCSTSILVCSAAQIDPINHDRIDFMAMTDSITREWDVSVRAVQCSLGGQSDLISNFELISWE